MKLLGGTIAAGGLALELPGAQAVATPHVKASPTTTIEHVIFIMLENHTYDSLFGSYNPKAGTANGKPSAPAPNPLYSDIVHSHCHYLASFLPRGTRGSTSPAWSRIGSQTYRPTGTMRPSSVK